jgi:hypothetical protein
MSNDSRNAAAALMCFDSVSFAICSVGIRRNYSFSVTVFSCTFVSFALSLANRIDGWELNPVGSRPYR